MLSAEWRICCLNQQQSELLLSGGTSVVVKGLGGTVSTVTLLLFVFGITHLKT